MRNEHPSQKEELDALSGRIGRIEDYLFGGGPGGPGVGRLADEFGELRKAIADLEGKIATKKDLDEIVERIARLERRDESGEIAVPSTA